MNWNCEQTELLLTDYLDGLLSAAEQHEFDAHCEALARAALLLSPASPTRFPPCTHCRKSIRRRVWFTTFSIKHSPARNRHRMGRRPAHGSAAIIRSASPMAAFLFCAMFLTFASFTSFS